MYIHHEVGYSTTVQGYSVKLLYSERERAFHLFMPEGVIKDGKQHDVYTHTHNLRSYTYTFKAAISLP